MARSEAMPVMLRSLGLAAAAALLIEAGASPEDSERGCPVDNAGKLDASCSMDMDEAGLLQHRKSKQLPLGVSVSTGSCTGGNSDPYASGSKVDCCSGLESCLGDWHGTATWSYLCITSCGNEPGPPPAETGLSICPKAVSMGSTSIWNAAASSNSCTSSKGIRGDTGFACADSSGAVDGSSIFVDMTSASDKVGCFVWETDDCQYPMKSVKQIDFDVEWDGCSNLWMAPIWTFSYPWAPDTGLQGLSGEIDFVEECPVPSVNTNLGCYNADQGAGCVDSQHWGEGTSSNGPQHMTMTLDTEGNLEVQVCAADKTGCKTVASYKNYLNIVYPTTDGRNNVYKFMSDIFNDQAGDGGWGGCKAVQNPTTTCKYAVTNIQIESNSNAPVFSDPNSKCYVLNAEKSLAMSKKTTMSQASH